jgi:hypothetical protein
MFRARSVVRALGHERSLDAFAQVLLRRWRGLTGEKRVIGTRYGRQHDHQQRDHGAAYAYAWCVHPLRHDNFFGFDRNINGEGCCSSIVHFQTNELFKLFNPTKTCFAFKVTTEAEGHRQA